MTEDSICRNCLYQGLVKILRLPETRHQLENTRRWCKEKIELDDFEKVVACTEFYDRTKVGKVPVSPDKRRWEKGA